MATPNTELRYDKHFNELITKSDYVEANICGLPNAEWLEQKWEGLPSEFPEGAKPRVYNKPINATQPYYFIKKK